MPNHNRLLLKLIAFLAIALSSSPSIAQWQYIKQVDKFTGENESYVRLRSKNSQLVGANSQSTNAEIVVFDSNKTDTFKAALMFAQHAVPVSFSYRGNYCTGSYECQALLKIDNGEPIQVPLVDSGKGDRAFVYLRIPSEDFLKNILEAKKIEMRIEFYNKGNGNFVFTSDGKNALNK